MHRSMSADAGFSHQFCELRILVLTMQEATKKTSRRLLEPNTYECPIRTIRTYWAEILIFDKKMSWSAQYVRMAMTLKILQVLLILPL